MQLEERVLNVVTNTLVTKTTKVDQGSNQNLTIRRVKVRAVPSGYCPTGTYPGSFNLTNKRGLDMATMISMSNVSASELTDTIRKEVESKMQADGSTDKKGTLAIGDTQDTSTTEILSEKTVKNLQTNIQMSLDSFMTQMDEANLIIEDIDLIPPCLVKGQPYPALTNESYVKMMATDITMNAVEALMGSEEAKKYTGEQKTTQASKNVGADGVLGEMVSDITRTVGGIGITWVVMAGVVLLALVLLLPMILKSLGGSGLVKNGRPHWWSPLPPPVG